MDLKDEEVSPAFLGKIIKHCGATKQHNSYICMCLTYLYALDNILDCLFGEAQSASWISWSSTELEGSQMPRCQRAFSDTPGMTQARGDRGQMEPVLSGEEGSPVPVVSAGQTA